MTDKKAASIESYIVKCIKGHVSVTAQPIYIKFVEKKCLPLTLLFTELTVNVCGPFPLILVMEKKKKKKKKKGKKIKTKTK